MRGGKDGQMVTLTKEQRKMLTRLETGLDFWELPEAEQERVLYLDSLGLSRAREEYGLTPHEAANIISQYNHLGKDGAKPSWDEYMNAIWALAYAGTLIGY